MVNQQLCRKGKGKYHMKLAKLALPIMLGLGLNAFAEDAPTPPASPESNAPSAPDAQAPDSAQPKTTKHGKKKHHKASQGTKQNASGAKADVGAPSDSAPAAN